MIAITWFSLPIHGMKNGQGHIGLETFRAIVNHPALRDLPFYLETPNDMAGYAREIALLRSLQQ